MTTLDVISVGMTQDDSRAASLVSAWGSRPAITTEADLWNGTALLRPSGTTAAIPQIVSSSASDVAGGGGAAVVRVRTISPTDYQLQTEDVTMNGVTPVALTKSAISIVDAEVISGSANVGAITVSIGGTELCSMAAGMGASGGAVLYVPPARRVVVVSVNVASNLAAMRAKLMHFPLASGVTKVIAEGYGGRAELVRRGIVIDGPALVWVRASTTSSSNVSATIEGVQNTLG